MTKKEKAKKFWNEHSEIILGVGSWVVFGVGAVLIGKNLSKKLKTTEALSCDLFNTDWMDESAQYLKDIGAEFNGNCNLPSVTREVAEKFLKERGKTYQLDIIDDNTACIWISK